MIETYEEVLDNMERTGNKPSTFAHWAKRIINLSDEKETEFYSIFRKYTGVVLPPLDVYGDGVLHQNAWIWSYLCSDDDVWEEYFENIEKGLPYNKKMREFRCLKQDIRTHRALQILRHFYGRRKV